MAKRFIIFYALISLALFFYSFTQVDLNLTLSRVSIAQTIQKSFQYIGYFRRPLSTWIYVFILVVFFALYAMVLRAVSLKKLDERGLWRLVLTVTILLLLSYPAFSNDMFNYMFTAKTVLVYHQNPYEVIPLQFSGIEPWITFMRWVHLPSAYTPLWILLTLPTYLLGFGYFLLVMWNIKILVAGFYVATIWGIGKCLHIVEKEHKVLGMAIFALNPLIIIESLVSAHNDITMMAVAVWAIYFALMKGSDLKIFQGLTPKLISWFALAVSVGLKLMTIFLIPVFFLKWNRVYALIFMILGLLLVVSQREILPWYWVWIMPFVALLPGERRVTLLATSVSLGLLLRYAPFIYFGNYNAPVPMLNNVLTWVPIAIGFLSVFATKVSR